jgi:hypothetical protein
MRYAVAFLLLLAMSVMTTAQADEKSRSPWSFPNVEIEAEKPWPGFYLPDLEGKPLSVQDYRGKKVVLHIFASW